MSLGLLLLIVLVLLLVGALPTWPYNRGRSYGWYPSSVLTVILVVILIAILLRGF